MVSLYVYAVFIALTGIERLIEVRLSNRHAAWSFEQGGKEFGRGHYPFMVVLHTGLLLACVVEAWWLERTFDPALGYSMLALAVLCQAGRWWCIQSLGQRWNTRVIIIPGLPPVQRGPYRWIRHPNYVIVALEGAALPCIHGAYGTAIAFSILNAGLMVVRIRCENNALATLPPHLEHDRHTASDHPTDLD